MMKKWIKIVLLILADTAFFTVCAWRGFDTEYIGHSIYWIEFGIGMALHTFTLLFYGKDIAKWIADFKVDI